MGAHVGDIGTIVRYVSKTDLSAATLLELKYKKPGATTFATWTGALYDTYAVEFETTLVTDLDKPGGWQLQIYAEKPGWSGHSDVKMFNIEPNVA